MHPTQAIQKLRRGLSDPRSALTLARLYSTPFLLGRFKDPEAARIGRLCWGELAREQVRDVFPGIETVDVQVHRVFDRVVGTNVSPLELLILTSTVRWLKAKRILEIGTFNGNTTLNLAANAPSDAIVTTVTLAEREQADVQYRNTPHESQVKQIYEDSTRLDWHALDTPFDFVFIDGCHEYDFVRKDTENALATTRPGGLIFWHDYGSRLDVSKAVDEVAHRVDAHAFIGTQLAVGIVR